LTPSRLHLLLIIAGCMAVMPAAVAECGNEYQVRGVVRDGGGRPVSDARVWVLLDKISEKKTIAQGIRARQARTDRSGIFSAHVVCGGENGGSNPCAKKARHLTIAAGGDGYGLKLRAFKLKDLEVVERGGVCLVDVPPFSLGTTIR